MNSSYQRRILSIVIIWFLLALTAGLSGITALMVPPAPQMILIGLVLILFVLFRTSPSFRSAILGIDIKLLVGVHLSRFVGFYFLYLYSLKRLPYDFAVLGGWGDIIVAVLALILILLVPLKDKRARAIYYFWNIIGLLDILFVVATAARLASEDPQSMSELLKLPLSLLPTFLVPIIIFTHFVIFIKLRSYKTVNYDKT